MVEIRNNKHIYAAYSNMAQHNFLMLLTHICNCLGSTDPDSNKVNEVKTLFGSKKVEQKAKLCALLNRHLPFMSSMTETVINKGWAKDEIDAMRFVFAKIEGVLTFYRNYTTHFDGDEDDEIGQLNLDERSLVPCLADLQKAALRTVQQRFNYAEREMSFIKNKDMGKESYKYCLYKKEIISSRDVKPTAVLSLRGLVFFLSLFLEKRYINEMLSKTKAFYTPADERNPKRKSIIYESLSVYRIRLPKNRFDSEHDDTALALDMLNELQRCPQELFDLLSPGDQLLFRSREKNDDDPGTMLMVRHSDRFAQFVMRFIDSQELFKSIRFQVALGKYRYAFYEKSCIDRQLVDETMRIRSLEKELHGFGRIDEIEAMRQKQWAGIIQEPNKMVPDSAQSTPYITDHRASYLLHNNRMGLYWKASSADPAPGLPQLLLDPQSPDLRERKKAGESIVKQILPKCFISTHEFPAMLFYMLLCEKLDVKTKKEASVPSVEKIIKDWVGGFNRFVGMVLQGEVNAANVMDVASACGIDYNRHVPKKLQAFIAGVKHDDEKMFEKLRERRAQHVAETRRLLDRFAADEQLVEDKRNRRGTRRFVEIKPGRLGAWLAHDIVSLQPLPANGGNKLTGLNFQILQSALSVYSGLDELKRVLVAAHLIMHDDAHPFLLSVLDSAPTTIRGFYKKYLEEKISWLESLPDAKLRDCTFLTRGSSKWVVRDQNYYTNLLNRYVGSPVELPRGLFEKAIKRVLQLRHGDDFIKGERREDANVAHLIVKYFHQVCNDENQEFYTQPQGQYKRYYSFFDILFNAMKDNEKYGKTVSEIEDFMRNDTSLSLITGCKDDSKVEINGELFEAAKQEITLKLAKSLAKNPHLDKAQRIKDIINTSHKLRALSVSQQNALSSLMLSAHQPKNAASGRAGVVHNYLKQFHDKEEYLRQQQRLQHALHQLKETERLIRRYKVQDIILFFMASKLLFNREGDFIGDKVNVFKLKNIRPIRRQDAGSALELAVPFSVTLHIKGSNVPVRIYQPSIKLKNYGDFMRFLYDSRINTLIPYLIDEDTAVRVEIERSELEREFEEYDGVRHEVFENVHKMERMILERHQELKDKSSPHYYYDDKGKRKAKRTNFSQLVIYDAKLNEEEGKEAVNIRNAFSHNSYFGENFGKVRISSSTLGEIAPSIGAVLEQTKEQIKNNK